MKSLSGGYSFLSLIYIFITSITFVGMRILFCVVMDHCMSTLKVRGHLVGVGSLLLSCGFWVELGFSDVAAGALSP